MRANCRVVEPVTDAVDLQIERLELLPPSHLPLRQRRHHRPVPRLTLELHRHGLRRERGAAGRKGDFAFRRLLPGEKIQVHAVDFDEFFRLHSGYFGVPGHPDVLLFPPVSLLYRGFPAGLVLLRRHFCSVETAVVVNYLV